MINPYAPLIAAVVILASLIGSYVKGRSDGESVERGNRAEFEEVERRTRDSAIAAAASEIAKIEVKNVTVQQKLETQIRDRVVYSDCKHDDAGLRTLNEAITGKSEPAGAGKLP